MPMYSLATGEARERFIDDFLEERIFTTGHFHRLEHAATIPVVFPTLFPDLEEARVDVKLLGGAFQYRSLANGVIISPFTGHQYPIFPSCNVVMIDEWLATVSLLQVVTGSLSKTVPDEWFAVLFPHKDRGGANG